MTGLAVRRVRVAQATDRRHVSFVGRGVADALRRAGAGSTNVTNCGGEVWVASVARGRVGIDAERIRSVPPGVAPRFFSSEELEWLEQVPDGSRRESFYRLWTVKEAMVKCWGTGLTFPLPHVAVPLQSRGVLGDTQWLSTVVDGEVAIAMAIA